MMSRCFTKFPIVVYENPIYNIIRFYLQEMGRLWRKSAPELMGVELLIMFVLILWLWRISGVTHRRWWGWFRRTQHIS